MKDQTTVVEGQQWREIPVDALSYLEAWLFCLLRKQYVVDLLLRKQYIESF